MRTIAGTAWSVEDAREYIEARVEINTCGCWIWQRGAVHDPHGFGGYGRHRIPGTPKRMLAHRTAYEAYIGQLPAHLHVMHACDVPACCNPAHLRVGTHQENMDDKVRKGRVPSKLTKSDVMAIRASTESVASLAMLYGVSRGAITDARSGRNWRHL